MEPSAHQPALFLIQTGISLLDSIVEGVPETIRNEEVFTVDLELPY